MDEMSWRARLARKNINILNIDEDRWYYEFMYHPKPGQTKWCKTFYEVGIKGVEFTHTGSRLHMESPEVIAKHIEDEVLELRKELED